MNWLGLACGILAGILLIILGYSAGRNVAEKEIVAHDEGITGPMGVQGPTGPTGAMGPTGPPGKCEHEETIQTLLNDVENLKERMPRVERKAGMSV